MEFRKILDKQGNRMDQLELLEHGNPDLEIRAIEYTEDECFINKYRGKYYRTYVFRQDGLYIGDTYEVEPKEETITTYTTVTA